MIYVILGTRAQLVKMAPVINLIEAKNWPIKLIHTGQHKESIDEICHDFKISADWHLLYRKSDEVKTISHALKWLTFLITKIIFKPLSLLPGADKSSNNIILVHGDTFSTVIGALLGKRLGIKVGHIESGLRSFNLFNPFPEEINRLITFRLMDIAFCPGQWAIDNLKKYNIKKINTINNTLLDSLRIAYASEAESGYMIPQHEYAVVSIHRFENIFLKKTFETIINQLLDISKEIHLVFILHPSTLKRLIKTGLITRIQNNKNISLRDRTGYFNFVKLISSCKFVITDGGSNQEELSYLNKPTFLMRKTTERQEGLNKNVFLGKLSKHSLVSFIDQIDNIERTKSILSQTPNSPSEIICQEISFAAQR